MTSKQIRSFRESKGLTQAQFAAMFAVSPTAVTQWEKGQVPSGPALMLLEHLIDGKPLFSSPEAADWDMPLTLKEFEDLERQRIRRGFNSLRDYLVWLARKDLVEDQAPTSMKPSAKKRKRHEPSR